MCRERGGPGNADDVKAAADVNAAIDGRLTSDDAAAPASADGRYDDASSSDVMSAANDANCDAGTTGVGW